MRIQSAVSTAAGLVDKLLGLGRRAPEPKSVDLRAVVGSVEELVRPSLADPMHRIELDLPPAPLLARADETEVMQVILNLVLNARDALPVGCESRIGIALLDAEGHTPIGQVLVGEIPRGPSALIRVHDTGSGTIEVDRYSLETSRERFYAGGDLITGASNVSNAMGYGKDAARSIDERLMGRQRFTSIFPEFAYAMEPPEVPGEDGRHVPAELPAAQRVLSYAEVSLGLTPVAAVREAARCLRCDVRSAEH